MISKEQLQIIVKATDMASATMDKIRKSADNLNDKMQRTAKHGVKALNDAIEKTAEIMTTGFAVGLTAVVGALGLATNTAMNFEAAMNQVQAVSGATAEELRSLRDQAKEMGKATKFSATEAAEGQAFLAQAGFKTHEIISALPDVLALAAAGNMELGRTADIASNIMGQFGIEAKDTARVTNLLAATASSSNTNIEQLGDAMKYLGPSAKSLGMSIEETAAIIGVLGDAGIQGSLAGEALGSSLVRLADPTKTMSDALEAMNVQAFDSQGSFVGMRSLLDQLAKGTSQMTQEQRAANLYAAFGAEAFQEINILLDRGAEKYGEFTKSITGTNKATVMAQIQQQGLKGAMVELESAVEGLMIDLLDLEVGGKRTIEWLAEGVVAVVDFVRAIDLNAAKDQVSNFMAQVEPAIEWLAKHPEIAQAALAGLAGIIITLVIGALGSMAAAAIAATWPFLALGTVVGGLYYAWSTNFMGIQQIMVQVVTWVQTVLWPILQEVFTQILAKINEFVVFFQTIFWSAIQPILMNLANVFIANVVPAVMRLWEELMKLWQLVEPYLMPILQILAVILGVIVVGAIMSAVFTITRIIDTITWLVAQIQIAITWFQEMANAIGRVFRGIVQLVTGVFTGNWRMAWEGVKNIFGGIWDGIAATAKAVINTIINGINGVIRLVNNLSGVAGTVGVNIPRVPEIPRFAKGGEFETNGPMLMMVGDNPGGRERVSITPTSSANIHGPREGRSGDMHLHIHVEKADDLPQEDKKIREWARKAKKILKEELDK